VASTLEAAMNFITGRKRSYQQTFQLNQPANVVVLEDLARFCRANETCVVPGDRDKSLVLEGRREVWLRLQQHLQLSPETLFDLYTGGQAPQQKG
jgi:hypothetical protein